MKPKKGYDLKALIGIGISFVVVAIVLSFGSTITDEIQDEVTETGTTARVNVTGADTSMKSDDTETFDEQARRDCSLSNMIVTNTTTVDIPFASGNYSIAACVLTWIGDAINNESSLNYSYTATYVDEKAAFNATEKGLEGLAEFADWLPTLALIIVAAVIIGIIVRYFAFGGA